jgi:hypothetical protein
MNLAAPYRLFLALCVVFFLTGAAVMIDRPGCIMTR